MSLKVQNVCDGVLSSGFWGGFEFEDEKRRRERGENEILKEKVNFIPKISLSTICSSSQCLFFKKRKCLKEFLISSCVKISFIDKHPV